MSFERAVQSLKAAADPTRLRLLAALSAGEATVGELQEILGQSQPRVSRHLKLLGDAGLVSRFRDGHWVYYRLAPSETADGLVAQIVALAASDTEQLDRDRSALSKVKRDREREVYAHGPGHAGVVLPGHRPSPEQLLEAVDDALDLPRLGDVLDIGSGAGALLCSLGQRADRIVGIDQSSDMRLLARSRLHRAGLHHGTVRGGDARALPFEAGSFDVVVLDEILSANADPRKILQEARRVLRRAGWLLILDRIVPVARALAAPEPPLIDNQLTALLAGQGCRVTSRVWFPGRALQFALFVVTPDLVAAGRSIDE